MVLISTYWNVNEGEFINYWYKFDVLISTYWNVNLTELLISTQTLRFNLNLLECKFFFTPFKKLK